ncbi:hypothetical protein TUM16664_06190 [Enterobacter cloacae]|nr:hypothetical protein TUM16664_06190 [Enterobacter cloacae]
MVIEDLNVNLALAKKLNDAETTNPEKLPSACPVRNVYMQTANTTQWMSVFITPIDVYFAKSFNIKLIYYLISLENSEV